MVRAVDSGVTTAPPLKRENCTHTKHDSAFSDWKILIGACDWEDYLLHKEGAERYRTHNLPNGASCPGLYELGIAISVTQTKGKSISKLDSKNIIPVYLGQADNVRTRLQQYGRDGDHLENGLSKVELNDRKVLGLFSGIFSYGFAIAFRWAPMESKKDAERTESQLLKTFDYAWNRGMNGERRPDDIHKKLIDTVSNPKRIFSVLKKIRVFPSKEVGLRIKQCDPPVLENGSSFYTKQNDTNTLLSIFKFGRSRPTLVSKDCNTNNDNVRICGVALGHGSICIRPPVKGRKRCVDHKGMKVNAYIKPRLTGTVCNSQKGCKEVKHEEMMVNEKKSTMSGADSLTCVAITVKGSCCSRKPSKNSKFCWQHEAIRAKIND
ncbi:protein EFFECTOR OF TRANSCRIPTION 2-like [Bidens hawaiensis]|uniref:protein EFFECTOR OF TRANSCRIPTION 2-like n=1 Tax=Bidens hawaiensis TaxID=980011 RepID=UPI00404B7B94